MRRDADKRQALFRVTRTHGACLIALALVGACGDDIPTVVAGLTEGLPAGVVTTSASGTSGTSGLANDDADGSSTGPPPIPSEDEVPTAIAVAACEAAAACECPNYDAGKCVIELRETFEQWQQYAQSKAFAYDEACLVELLGNIGTPECITTSRITECAVYQGDLGLDETCEGAPLWQGECEGELFCAQGQCVESGDEPPPLGEGEPCFDTEVGIILGVCDDELSLSCDFQAGICVARPQIGFPCEEGGCAPGAWCDEDDDDGPVCKMVMPPNSVCTSGSGCTTGLCNEGRCLAISSECLFLLQWG